MTGRLVRLRPARWWYGVAALLVLALAAWLIGFSSVLGVRSVNVVGARTVTAAQVRAAAGIRPGTPLARLDLAAVRDRLRAVAPIRTVTVSRSYPATVTIRITERVAIGYRPVDPGTGGGAVLLVDRDNVAFRTVSAVPKHLPRLLVPATGASATAAALVAGALPAAIVAKLASVSAPSEQSVTLSLRDGRSVLWGGTDRSADKARLLAVLLGRPGRYFDLSDPSAVTSRLDPGN
ncbi:cell division protein FtsQ/DivIB [Jatrophihabitans sp.]|uniref:cell division protein FtsQ/DivIB n=1 Tax=Jatrophihabitans sp. TaxID=1932789 RepID=UPI002CFB36FA|nr:FtsQ-type POTRA domain-containing protein [Jatrophihabitans sp.]